MKSVRTKKRLVVLAVVMMLLLVIVPVAQAWPFGDVPVGYWAYNAIRRISYLNITGGCGGGNYCPEQNVTRAQMAGFLNNLTNAYTTQDEPYILNVDHKYLYNDRPAIVANANGGTGVIGFSYGAGNADNGVYGQTNSTDSSEAGVFGVSSSYAAGVRGSNSSSGRGVYGTTSTGWGVYGYASSNTGTNYGVYGLTVSTAGYGVCGYASNSSGTNYGVYGRTLSISGYPVYGRQASSPASASFSWIPGGFFSGRNGVIGITNTDGGNAVAGEHTTGNGSAILGYNTSATGVAGIFHSVAGNGVLVLSPSGSAGLVVSGGSKSAAVTTDEGSRLLYTEEATEVWFNDHGFGQLQDGTALIAIDPLYAQTVNLEEPYHVFVQVYGGAEVYVSNRTPTGFEVHLWDGDPNVEFSYRIMAKRLGYQDDRLEAAPWADIGGPLQHTDGAEAPVEPDVSPPPLEPQPEEGP